VLSWELFSESCVKHSRKTRFSGKPLHNYLKMSKRDKQLVLNQTHQKSIQVRLVWRGNEVQRFFGLGVSEHGPKLVEQYQHVVIHASLRRDGVNGDMDWYCPARA
jgi:hypothetical protein